MRLTATEAIPPKRPGKHRFIAVLLHDVPEELALEGGSLSLNNETLLGMVIACWDCEKATTEIDSPVCSAPAVTTTLVNGTRQR